MRGGLVRGLIPSVTREPKRAHGGSREGDDRREPQPRPRITPHDHSQVWRNRGVKGGLVGDVAHGV